MNKNDWNHLLISIDIMENLSLKRQIYPFQKLLNSRSEFSNFLNGRKKYIKISSIVDSKGKNIKICDANLNIFSL